MLRVPRIVYGSSFIHFLSTGYSSSLQKEILHNVHRHQSPFPPQPAPVDGELIDKFHAGDHP